MSNPNQSGFLIYLNTIAEVVDQNVEILIVYFVVLSIIIFKIYSVYDIKNISLNYITIFYNINVLYHESVLMIDLKAVLGVAYPPIVPFLMFPGVSWKRCIYLICAKTYNKL